MFIAHAIGESLWPKQTGQASAAAARQHEQRQERSLRAHRFLVFRWNAAPYTARPPATSERADGGHHVASPDAPARYWPTAHAAQNAASTTDSAMNNR